MACKSLLGKKSEKKSFDRTNICSKAWRQQKKEDSNLLTKIRFGGGRMKGGRERGSERESRRRRLWQGPDQNVLCRFVTEF